MGGSHISQQTMNEAAPLKKTTAARKRKANDVALAPTVAKTSRSDSKGRVVLGPRHANKMFRVSEQPDGNILLEPMVAIHEREAWLFQNPEALAMVRKGIQESLAGERVYLGSFAQYAGLDIDDDDDED